jgi:hypothetical protein
MKRHIPIDIINYICEFAVDNNHLWYPFFSPKTGNVSWKVNPYCTKYIQLARKLLNEIRVSLLTIYNVKTLEGREIQSRVIHFRQPEAVYIEKIYIEFDLDEDSNGSFMARAMLVVFNHGINKNDMLYLNGTPYANINFGWVVPKFGPYRNGIITIGYETY